MDFLIYDQKKIIQPLRAIEEAYENSITPLRFGVDDSFWGRGIFTGSPSPKGVDVKMENAAVAPS